jgi:hypothetical protein
MHLPLCKRDGGEPPAGFLTRSITTLLTACLWWLLREIAWNYCLYPLLCHVLFLVSPTTDLPVRLFPAISFRLASGAFYRSVIEVKYEI